MLRLAFALVAASATCAESPVMPFTVCEILRDKAMYEGKPVAALGRYSFRQDGRWLGEQGCQDNSTVPPAIWLTEDGNEGPRPPENFELDGIALSHKLADVRKRTSLAKFRFGSPDYDRWAVVYGRVVSRQGEGAKRAALDLVFRGDGVIIFLNQ
ncbi:MAG: hypothetical protein C5B51_20925 [Terriglobia bacterium]|nr:MAG: hypothetical protein C5B51_20925 [Terriglobia bacterium]